tara:strand:- start:117 stop:653 length:537 start_codon:yes stop_codon:yes gene_type:complete
MKNFKIGFMSLPKNAHTSISQIFPQFNNFPNFHPDWLEKGKHFCLERDGETESYDFLFTSIRNPYDRFFSSYNQSCRYGYNKDIDAFANDLMQNNLSHMQLWHSQSQTMHLILPSIDFFIRVENIDEDIIDLCDLLKIEKPNLIHKNNFKKDYSKNSNDILNSKIHKIFEKDFDLLKY